MHITLGMNFILILLIQYLCCKCLLHAATVDATPKDPSGPQDIPTMTLNQWLSVGRCRAWCGHEFLYSIKGVPPITHDIQSASHSGAGNRGTPTPAILDDDCTNNVNCSACWDLCERLVGGGSVWATACAFKGLCRPLARGGCDAACAYREHVTGEVEPLLAKTLAIPKISITKVIDLHLLRVSFSGINTRIYLIALVDVQFTM